jgi:GNAT superfamily N-acetyltransferase
VDVALVPPDSAGARAVLEAYFRDVVSWFHRREATQDEVGAAMKKGPSDDLRPPSGVFFVARRGGAVIGCAGLRPAGEGTGEVTRVFVLPRARRRGVGQALLDAVEDAARKHGLARLRLDANSPCTYCAGPAPATLQFEPNEVRMALGGRRTDAGGDVAQLCGRLRGDGHGTGRL